MPGYVEPLSFTGAVLQRKSFPDAILSFLALSLIAVSDPERGPRHGKVGIKLHRTLQTRNGAFVIKCGMCSLPNAEFFEGVERRGCGSFEGNGKFLDRTDGFTQSLAQLRCSTIQRLEDLFLTFRFDLFVVQRIATLCVHGLQRDDIMTSKTGDGAIDHCLDTFAQANFTRHIFRDSFLRRTAHKPHCLLNSRFGKNVDVG
jgi:hypothetical protein